MSSSKVFQLTGIIKDYYAEADIRNQRLIQQYPGLKQKIIPADSTLGHSLRVRENAEQIYQLLNLEAEEKTILAALSHDCGRYEPKSWIKFYQNLADWIDYTNNNHALLGRVTCLPLLRSAGCSPEEIEIIKEMVGRHDDQNMSYQDDLNLRVLMMADQLDKFSPEGVGRVLENRKSLNYCSEEARDETSQICDGGFNRTIKIMLPKEKNLLYGYFRDQYEIGKKEIMTCLAKLWP